MLWSLSTKPFSAKVVLTWAFVFISLLRGPECSGATWLMEHTDKARTARAQPDRSLMALHSAEVFSNAYILCATQREREDKEGLWFQQVEEELKVYRVSC